MDHNHKGSGNNKFQIGFEHDTTGITNQVKIE